MAGFLSENKPNWRQEQIDAAVRRGYERAIGEQEKVSELIKRLTCALYKYEQDAMDFDFPPTFEHKNMMELAEKTLKSLRKPVEGD